MMAASFLLAHGGPAGAALEVGFVLVPIIIFVILSRVSPRRREAEEAEEAEGEGQ